MSRVLPLLLAAGLATAGSNAAHAVDGAVPFTSAVTSVCAITIGTPGVMATSADSTSMDSANGTSGTAVVVATGGNFEMSAIAPTDFTVKPPTYTGSTSFTATYSSNGATVLGSGAGGVARDLLPGVTTATVDLKADSDAGPFHAGAYTAIVTLRCEADGS